MRVHLRSLTAWFRYKIKEHGGILLTNAEWKEKTKVDYKTFTANKYFPDHEAKQEGDSALPKRTVDQVAEFKKGTRRDASLYPTLKDNWNWNNWNRLVIAQAQAHDLKEVFDTEYVPKEEEEKKLFIKKQCFTYALLNRIVQTDEGKAFVRQHEKDYDAQTVYRKLLDFATKSTSAELAKDNLIKFLTTTKMDSRWTGTTVGFILHWCKQMRILDDMSTYEDRFRDNVQKRMMESAVKNLPKLATINDIDINQTATGGKVMTFSQYKDTLIAAATRRDEKLKPSLLRTKHVVQATSNKYYNGRNSDWFDQGYLDAGEDYYGTFEDNIVQVNCMMQRNTNNNRERNSNRVPREIWDKLTPEIQADFRELNKQRALQFKQKGARRSTNSHDLIAYTEEDNFLSDDGDAAYMMDHDTKINNSTNNGKEEDNSNAIIAHITKQRIIPMLHDVQSILASAHKRTDVNNYQQGQQNNNK